MTVAEDPVSGSCTTGVVLDERGLLSALLAEQQQTAVEQFARWHSAKPRVERTRPYRALVPLSAPQAGQQYAFEVDLDACSGCKACVTACHNLNGLEEGEAWRSVGLLHGGASELPVVQHVTTACHHCLDPACLNCCPVEAYEKDPLTGIVRHLDDQCIGCQYCTLTCPYDVPRYSRRLGIVRKCDMCSTRLSAGEAPACVQSCPNQAIRITLVWQQEVLETGEANGFLPGAPAPGNTLPTTVYKSARPLPRNLLPADYYTAAPQHAHLPLVVMLVLTQMSVGAFAIDGLLAWEGVVSGELSSVSRTVHLLTALGLGLLGLAASVLHLGRPQYAYRAILGWRRSWLSREIAAFGAFTLLSVLYAAAAALLADRSTLLVCLGAGVAIAGAVGVFCSAMIYASTQRPFWSAPLTLAKFAGTSAVLGIPLALIVLLAAAGWSPRQTIDGAMHVHGASLCGWLLVAATAKQLLECTLFLRLRSRPFTPMKRTAVIMSGDLAPITLKRFLFGAAGGVLLPGLLYAVYGDGEASLHPALVLFAAALLLGLNVLGELLERYLFFTAVVAPKMPGVM